MDTEVCACTKYIAIYTQARFPYALQLWGGVGTSVFPCKSSQAVIRVNTLVSS